MSDVTLPGFFGDGMVLQRDQVVPIWGWGQPGEAVVLSFAGQTEKAVVDEFGSWSVRLKPMKASAVGRPLVVNGHALKDVLVGEVWLCSGSTDMAYPVRKCSDSRDVLEAANHPLVRLISISKAQSPLPEKDATGTWMPAVKDKVANFSATGYFFARKRHLDLGVPVGIINASWGGTNFNSWIPAEGFRDEPQLKFAIDQIYNGRPSTAIGKERWQQYLQDLAAWLPKAKAAIAKSQTPTDRPEIPTDLWITNIVPTKVFNGMIQPLIPYAIGGVIWEHEENSRRPAEVYAKQKALINSWRLLWQRELPFYFAEFHGTGKPADADKLNQMRTAQQNCLTITGTGMIQTNDLPVPNNRAPQNKQPIGERFSKLAASAP